MILKIFFKFSIKNESLKAKKLMYFLAILKTISVVKNISNKVNNKFVTRKKF